ncbi:MAG TPA: rhodanese-like domain-containing protein [Patescibacteria group bacterium]|nr:rhodanese-like domain-containing protein [Patescibacteria group bacterium]
MQPITQQELKRLIDSGEDLAILEALPKSEYAQGHLPGAVSMPLEKIAEEAPRALPDKSQKIVTYCSSADCAASTKAAEILESMGYTNVSDFVEGKAGWKLAGLPLQGEKNIYDEGLKGDDMEDGQGVADAVSSRTIEDLESLARDYQRDYRNDGNVPDPNYFNPNEQGGREIY